MYLINSDIFSDKEEKVNATQFQADSTAPGKFITF